MPSEESSGNQPVLLTGFEPYGGLDLNPSAALARELDGAVVAGHAIRGHVIPVALDGLEARLAGLIEDCAPALVLCLGLYPGEAVIRLERFGVNLADFEIPDNAGRRAQSQPLSADAPTALARGARRCRGRGRRSTRARAGWPTGTRWSPWPDPSCRAGSAWAPTGSPVVSSQVAPANLGPWLRLPATRPPRRAPPAASPCAAG